MKPFSERSRILIELSSFDKITDAARLEQITYTFGGLYEKLRIWLENYQLFQPEPLDVFISRIFGEVLSQPGFGMHNQFEHAAICARLVESIQKFRRVIVQAGTLNGKDVSQEYVEMVERGILAAQYLDRPGAQSENAVLLSPAYSFLMSNRSVEYQFWLDIGNITWSERLDQPLTHPYVLSRNWNQNEK